MESFGFNHGLSFGFGTSSSEPTPPPEFGVLGINTDLPNSDFEHAGGNIIAVSFECVQDATAFLQSVRAKSSSNPSNNMRAGFYLKTGTDSGNSLVLSSDVVPFGTSFSILEFDQNSEILNGNEYWLAFQAQDGWFFPYDSAPGANFIFLGNFPFGTFPSSFSGEPTFDVVCQFWIDYFYTP